MSHNWKNILVSERTTIQEVLTIINTEALQLVLVVDGLNRLLGTVTDGDIRRAVINNIPLSQPIYEIMSTSPVTADCSLTKVKVRELMKTKQLYAIPIVNNGIVVGLETIHSITKRPIYDNPVFLMAGGFGTRL